VRLIRTSVLGVVLAGALSGGCGERRPSGGEGPTSIRIDPDGIPPGPYPIHDLGFDPSKWTWVWDAKRPIEAVLIDPGRPLERELELGKDFHGTFEGTTVRVHFRCPGAHAVRIVFSDSSVPPEVHLILVSATMLSPAR
jgi:hypothetical protein